MKLASLIAAAAVVRVAYAHTYVYALWVNGEDQGRGDVAPGYVRKIPNNDPVKDVKSPDMTCNKGAGPAAKVVDVKGGDDITVEWAHDKRGDDILADSHKGPVQVYMAPTATEGKGNVWVKVASAGFNNGVWATDNLIKNKGKHSFKMPDVASGDYLIRPEVLGLHEGENLGGAQFYMSCIQVRVTSNGQTKLPTGIAIPGEYTPTDPGIKFNIYNTPIPAYTPPGGPVWNRVAGAGGQAAPTVQAPPAPEPSDSAPAPQQPGQQQQPPQPPQQPQSPQPQQPKSPRPPRPQWGGFPWGWPKTGGGGRGVAQHWQQCGGKEWKGATTCASGLTCKKLNDWYFQCL